MEDFLLFSATELAKAIRNKKISAVEVIKAYLKRIKTVNPKINAVVQVTEKIALKQAEDSDAAPSRGELKGPLHGVPMTIKDSFDTAGVISTWGTPGRSKLVPTQDATVVARLKAAGAILVGKTNTPEFTLAFETDNPIHGRTNNPYNKDRTPGGSSGGAAAIVTAGGSPFDIGTDTAGSIRLPSHFCGVCGIKHTSGRVSRAGHAIPPGSLVDSLTQVGPIARYVEDLMLILPIIAGPYGIDPFIVPAPLGSSDTAILKGLRGTFYTDNGIQTPTNETVEAVQLSVKSLIGAGLEFVEKRPPGIEETLELFNNFFSWDGGAWYRFILEPAGTSLDQTSLRMIDNDTEATPDKLVRLIDHWDNFRARMLAFMSNYDVIISPVSASQAISHGTSWNRINDFSYTMTYNLTGWPSTVVREVAAEDGLPIGVQITSKPWREDVALEVAHYLEKTLGGWQQPPI